MAKHTPAPWRFVAGNQIRSDQHQIARVWMMRNGEGVANAHLIEAAPEMLEALKRVKETGVFLGAIPQGMVDAAIAKALPDNS